RGTPFPRLRKARRALSYTAGREAFARLTTPPKITGIRDFARIGAAVVSAHGRIPARAVRVGVRWRRRRAGRSRRTTRCSAEAPGRRINPLSPLDLRA